jgi:mannose-1-phosphate guanylyltransferase/phosphomannomutase
MVMPNVLAKLGASVLAVNPYATTLGLTSSGADHDARVRDLGNLVRTSGSDLGFVFSPDGETSTIIDDAGVPLSAEQALLVLVKLVCRKHPGQRIALPVAVSREAERLAAEQGVEIVWSKLSAPHIMEIAASGDVVFAASQENGFVWPAFLPAYDAAATLVNLLELLAEGDDSLSELLAAVPEIHHVHDTVSTPWERKGTVMRGLLERVKDHPVVLVDGIKFLYPDGWALVLPDPDVAITHIWAEGPNEAEARRLLAVHAGQVAELTRD